MTPRETPDAGPEASAAPQSGIGPVDFVIADPIDRSAPDGLAQQLVRRLTESIRSGELRAGERLPTESELVRIHGVSRTVVREAMSRLNAQGLVATQQGRGSFVLAVPSSVPFAVDASGARTPEDFLELLDLRLGFETEAAALAARRADARRIADIKAAFAKFADEVESPGASVAADFDFHRSVALASHNRYFVQLLDSLGSAAIAAPRERLSMSTDAEPLWHLHLVAVEHENIYRAIARRNPDDARAAMRVHLANSQERVTGLSEVGHG
ncbi:FadR/GntR family transcriptional regulator [Planctomonas sp. JC2975]|uniref:FCD domain-containing protein n=1 Tax=Planctomonas sp. JC2975 TaxID=2729626 RepID=UPI00197B1A85